MKLEVIRSPYNLIDASNPDDKENRDRHVLQPGEYEVERIPNPYGHENAPWIVLKGTKIGSTEGSIRQWWNETENWEPWVKLYDDDGSILHEGNYFH